MALGNNLKKKKLIPDSSKDTSDKKKESKKPTAKKKATKALPKKVSTKKKSTDTKLSKKTNQVKSLSKKTSQKTKSSEKHQQVEDFQTIDLVPSMVQEQNPENVRSSHDQIISAYSVYIAQELFERKTALRKQYVQEVTNLQGKPIQFILMTIGTERYALDIDSVKEVVPIPTISKTPNTPSHIQGVVSVRGNSYVVFDLAKKFNVIAQEVSRYLLVLSNKELKSSITLSALPSTFKTNGSQISYSIQTIENALLDASYIKGMIQDGDELIYYLDLVELLKNDKAIVIPDNLVKEQ